MLQFLAFGICGWYSVFGVHVFSQLVHGSSQEQITDNKIHTDVT